ncbi:hypothetical protein HYFRA_00007933 [Hymenoscyphus fraxineus]|uniref:Ubiquitin-conjugating enzyme E2 H n=1 Tax=Hymenoscyphus fraxineus TaxID=746836 RepID=A0A9N9PLJ0_9HELO|nr:hypothetical protein HYFRA_00007933 [Hymenoscyphus fraxineus]
MSSPRRRIETDVSERTHGICECKRLTGGSLFAGCMHSGSPSTFPMYLPRHRLMSDYEVTLVNDNTSPSVIDNGMFMMKLQAGILRSIQGSRREYVDSGRKHKDIQTDTWTAPFQGGCWKVHVELPDQYPYKSPSIGFVNRIFHPNIDELYGFSPASGSVCLDVINQTWSPMFDMINIFEVFLPQLLRYPNPTDPLNGEAAALLMREPKSYDAKVKEYVVKYASKDAADEAGAESDDDDDMSSVGSFGDEDDEPAGTMEEV